MLLITKINDNNANATATFRLLVMINSTLNEVEAYCFYTIIIHKLHILTKVDLSFIILNLLEYCSIVFYISFEISYPLKDKQSTAITIEYLVKLYTQRLEKRNIVFYVF